MFHSTASRSKRYTNTWCTRWRRREVRGSSRSPTFPHFSLSLSLSFQDSLTFFYSSSSSFSSFFVFSFFFFFVFFFFFFFVRRRDERKTYRRRERKITKAKIREMWNKDVEDEVRGKEWKRDGRNSGNGLK